ncbi:iron ABC transporter permease [Alteribacillus sp. YIM 98480]|uniref:FecCD family ABC transporter permease n=1 Tax=Alteribacillus sp. YIM 98480 TaxID=2606599 RepID=UPI00131DE429|nr:iron ABC transporter permease [Alteribacillus sp. YIM 98480]
MKHKYLVPIPFLFAGLTAFLFLSFFASLMLGSASVPVNDVFGVLWKAAAGYSPADMTTYDHIVWSLRIPRTILALTVGAGLAIVGVAIQALVKNPLADPYILGVSSGASVGATLVILAGAFSFFGTYAVSGAAFLGALLTVVTVYILAQNRFKISVSRLLLSGVAVSMMLSALTSFLVMMNPREEGIQTALYWMLGSLSGAAFDELWLPVAVVALGYCFLHQSFRSLNVLVTDDATAQSLGLNIESFKAVIIIITALITGVLVAFSGAIGFVGLMIPHMARIIVGADHRVLLPASAMLGAVFMVLADIAARMLVAPEELPIGIVTAICGGPFFIWLLRRSNYVV